MKYTDLNLKDVARLLNKFSMVVDRAEKGHKKLKDLINKAENVARNHGERITQNEENIQAGKNKFSELEQRLNDLEGVLNVTDLPNR